MSDFNAPVYRAASSGVTQEELRRVIDECAQGDEQRRDQAVNQPGADNETPLQAAHRQKRGDLVGALVEAGADVGVGSVFEGKLTPLAVCIAYGQVDSVRAMLRVGHDANEKIVWNPYTGSSIGEHVCFAAHFCLAPPPLGVPLDRAFWGKMIGAPQIGCLEVLLREGGADVNALIWQGETPIFWLARYGWTWSEEEHKAACDLLLAAGARTSGVFDRTGCPPLMAAAEKSNTRFARFLIEEAGAPVDERNPGDGFTALHHCCSWAKKDDPEMAALLLDAGAEIEARDKYGWTPLYWCVELSMSRVLARVLLDRGASVDVIATDRGTPLLAACRHGIWSDDEGWPLFQEILLRSSTETRRSVSDGSSAVDYLARDLEYSRGGSAEEDLRVRERCRWAIAELLASGAPALRPENAAAVLPIAASVTARQEDKLEAWRAELRSWRAHETFVGLSLDVKELREAQAAVEERRARVEALKRELRELGAGSETESSSEGESDDEDESDSEEETEGGSECESESESGSEDEDDAGAAAAAPESGGSAE